jgi:hypothetical protein
MDSCAVFLTRSPYPLSSLFNLKNAPFWIYYVRKEYCSYYSCHTEVAPFHRSKTPHVTRKNIRLPVTLVLRTCVSSIRKNNAAFLTWVYNYSISALYTDSQHQSQFDMRPEFCTNIISCGFTHNNFGCMYIRPSDTIFLRKPFFSLRLLLIILRYQLMHFWRNILSFSTTFSLRETALYDFLLVYVSLSLKELKHRPKVFWTG